MVAAKAKNKSLGVKFIKGLFITLNLLAVLMLAGATLAAFISPEKQSYLPFLGLAYPFLVVLNLIFAIVWLIFNWKWALLSLLTIGAGWFHLRTHIQYHGQHNYKKGEIPVKVITYNVRNFDIYNYSKDWVTNTDKRNKIFRYLKQEQADIICFQEFVHDLSGSFNTLDSLTELMDAKNVHVEYTFTSRKIIEFGIATFTKYPIVNKGRINFKNSSNNLCIYTDILLGEDTVRVYNAHFESIHFSQQDYAYTKDVAEFSEVEKHKSASRRIASLLRAAFIDRASQTRQVAEHIATCPYPCLLMTDLNDTPASYAYQQLTDDLDDAFVSCGSGLGYSYAGIYPGFRIDYIFVSDEFDAWNMVTRDLEYSDHYPLSCDVVLKTKE